MNFTEKTLNSKVVYDGKVITVIKDDVEVADGHKSFREVVLHSGGVVIAALKNPETILLVKQYRYPLKETILELPAGKLEKGENPDFAAKGNLKKKQDTVQKIGTLLDISTQLQEFVQRNYTSTLQPI